MIRLSSLTGLPVVLAGCIVGSVEQGVLTRDGRTLRGLILRRGMGTARWTPEEDVLLLGTVSVIVSRKPGRVPADAGFAFTSVKDTAGLYLGRVTDVWIDPVTRRSGALEVSLGPVETLNGGRLLAHTFRACPAPDDPGQVLVPAGMPLEQRAPGPVW